MKYISWLNRVLENRELRAKKQRELCQKYNSSILSLIINIPGKSKCSDEAKYIFDVAIIEIENLDLEILERHTVAEDTGYEAIFAVNIVAVDLKEMVCKIEDCHPIGRFMDIDVIDNSMNILSRNYNRKCYICNKDAKVCSRVQSHSELELLKFIKNSVDDYRLSL